MHSRPNLASISLVATDLDGTLLRGDKTVSARTVDVLRRVREAGIAVALVTGRPPRTVRQLAARAGVGGLAVCCNGGIVYDLDSEAVILNEMMPGEVAQRLVATFRAAIPGVCFATERGVEFGHEAAYTALYAATATIPDDPPHATDDAHTLCAQGVTKLIVRHPAMPVPELYARAQALVGEAATATHSGAPFIEISAAGITKASALAHLCMRLGITAAQVIAFGDMPNDLPMLAFAGCGVAVANAHPDVRAAVDELTATNDEDGVALVLERLLRQTGE